MTYGSNEQGEATFTLSPLEHEAFKKGELVIKRSSDSQGDFEIVLNMNRLPDNTKLPGPKPRWMTGRLDKRYRHGQS